MKHPTPILDLIIIALAGWIFSDRFEVHVPGNGNVEITPRGTDVARDSGRPAGDLTNPPPVRTTGTIRVAAFNIQVFGTTKAGKAHVMDKLARIVREFDVVAIQEIRARKQDIIPSFVDLINTTGRKYDYALGPRLGRTSSKEQYAFIYNTDRIELDPNSVLSMDDPTDLLHREPLLGRFRARTMDPARGFTFWLLNTHTDPDEVPSEIDALADAFASVQQKGWGEDDVILLGDLNASEQQLDRLGQLPGRPEPGPGKLGRRQPGQRLRPLPRRSR